MLQVVECEFWILCSIWCCYIFDVKNAFNVRIVRFIKKSFFREDLASVILITVLTPQCTLTKPTYELSILGFPVWIFLAQLCYGFLTSLNTLDSQQVSIEGSIYTVCVFEELCACICSTLSDIEKMLLFSKGKTIIK